LDLPAEASDDDAKSAAGKLVIDLASDFHGAVLEIDWVAGDSPHSWTGTTRHLGTQTP
jgi:hypothetical protein